MNNYQKQVFQLQKSNPINTKVKLIQKTAINHDCYRMKLKFLTQRFKITIGQSINIILAIQNEKYQQSQFISRRYSIISPSTNENDFEIIFKIYRPCQKHPQGGQMTTLLQKLPINSQINIQGPFSRINYFGDYNFQLNGDKHQFKNVYFIAGGSGITPCYQTIGQILSKKSNKKVQIMLLYANKTEEDIILRKQLEQLQQKSQKHFQIHYSLQQTPEGWKGEKGLVSIEMIQKYCKLDDPHTLFIHCGPVGMTKLIILHFMKYCEKMKLFKF